MEVKTNFPNSVDRSVVILMVLDSFHQKGIEEVSLPEFLECMKTVQDEIPMQYDFSERYLYSLELFEDLRNLEFQGFAHRFAYKHNGFLPKRHITLTGLGKSRVKNISHDFPQSTKEIFDRSVETTIQSFKNRIKLFARPHRCVIRD